MKITIAEFAESRGVDRDTVNAFLRRNPTIKSATKRVGKNIVIDTEDEAFGALDKQYPFPQPIQVVEDTESRKRLIEAQQTIIRLQNQLNSQMAKLAAAEASQILLEDKAKQIEKMEQRYDALQLKYDALDRQHTEEIKTLQSELEKEKSKSWWAKLLGK